jgi:HD-GYP domain-containing protein (c-di-GMP phosphodiesterase class II)
VADDILAGHQADAGDQAELARRFVIELHLLIRLAAVHEAGNTALQKPAGRLRAVIASLSEANPGWRFRLVADQLFVNDSRVKLDQPIFHAYTDLVEELKRRSIGGITFERTPTEDELLRFAFLIQHAQVTPGLDTLEMTLEGGGLGFIRLDQWRETVGRPAGNPKGQVRRAARETFFGSIFLTGGLLQTVDRQRVVHVRRARRVVQSFLDLLGKDEDYLLGMTNIKNYDDYTFNHSVNVTILALNMGRHLKFSRPQLSDLGLSAMFHDLGKTMLPRDLVNKQSRLDDDEWKIMIRHPVEGVKKLLRIKGVSQVTVKMILSVYEHHVNFDFSGYPNQPLTDRAFLFSRILRIVDSYDAMTTMRSYTVRPKHPVAALEEIWNLSGTHFDPDLAKVFIRMMGIYPVGTIVQLSGGGIGLVVGRKDDGEIRPPLVRVIAHWDEQAPTGEIIEPAEAGDSSIIGYYDFGDVPVNPAWYLLTTEDIYPE